MIKITDSTFHKSIMGNILDRAAVVSASFDARDIPGGSGMSCAVAFGTEDAQGEFVPVDLKSREYTVSHFWPIDQWEMQVKEAHTAAIVVRDGADLFTEVLSFCETLLVRDTVFGVGAAIVRDKRPNALKVQR